MGEKQNRCIAQAIKIYQPLSEYQEMLSYEDDYNENQKALDEHARIERDLKAHTKNIRAIKKAELIARNPELYNENTGDGRVAINRVLYELVKTDPTTIA